MRAFGTLTWVALLLLTGCATFRTASLSENGDTVLILLDNSGVDPSFTNPVRRRAIEGKGLLFQNITLDRTIEVTLYLIVLPEVTSFPGGVIPTCQRLARNNGLIASVLPLVGTDASGEVGADGSLGRFLCEFQYTLPPRSVQTVPADLLALAQEMPIRFMVDFFDKDERPANPVGYIDYWKAVEPGLSGTAPAAPPPTPPMVSAVSTQPPTKIVLKNDGVASADFRNGRRPTAVFWDKTDESTVLLDDLQSRVVQFVNETDRAMTVSFPVRLDRQDTRLQGFGAENPVGAFLARYSASLPGCQPAAGNVTDCNFQVPVNSDDTTEVRLLLLSLSPDRPIRFRVAFSQPAGPLDKPAQPIGFLRIVNNRPAIPDRFDLLVSGSIERTDDAYLGLPDASGTLLLFENNPYKGARRDFYSATGRIDFNYMMSDRAKGRLRLIFKDGAVGAKADDKVNALSAPEYEFQVFGTTGLSLRFGKLTFAQPSAPMALRERGEGYSLIYNRWSLTHILRRESANFIPDNQDDDSQAVVFQMQKMPVRLPYLRTYSLFAVYGEEEGRKIPVAQDIEELAAWNYRTLGGEVTFVVPGRIFGNASVFWSAREARQGPQVDGGGRSWLLDASYIPSFGGGHHSFTLVVGEGTGNDPGTARNEGYIGETGIFSRDSIFLSKIAPALRVQDIRNPNPVSGGLSNKQYVSLQYGHSGFSPLALFARHVLRIEPDDIASRSTNFKIHDYTLQKSYLGQSDAGWEADLEFLVETPKGVKVSLSAAYFERGEALRTFLHDDVWSITGRVSIEPQ